jgi:Type II site-specific deoxyribonuclease
MSNDRARQIQLLVERLYRLTDSQINWVEEIISQFTVAHNYEIIDSNLFDTCMLDSFGDALLIHHCMSKESFSKDKFEYVLERVATFCGNDAQVASRGNPGHDITINGERFSLKTQADRNIKENEIHISKFMELGQGQWGDDPEDLMRLREQFFRHMNSYERIFSLRTLSKSPNNWIYELVEIPKALLLEARSGELRMMTNSKQSPKPGYCYIRDEIGEEKFQLYFDGGSERKLQIKRLLKRYCCVHARWQFPPIDLYAQL